MTTGLGITIPLGAPLPAHTTLLPRLAAGGYRHFWSSETAAFDAFTPLAHAAAVLPDAHLGTAIAGVFTRGPALLAMNAAALAEAAPGRFSLGVGAASPAIVARWNGIRRTVTRKPASSRTISRIWMRWAWKTAPNCATGKSARRTGRASSSTMQGLRSFRWSFCW